MLNDAQLLLDAAFKNLGDNAPRLLLADALQDSDPHNENGWITAAELIRVQCALHSPQEGDPSRETLQEKERALLIAYSALPIKPWKNMLKDLKVTAVTLERGFPVGVKMPLAAFLKSGGELFKRMPTVCGLDLSWQELKPEDMAALAGSPHLSKLTSLDLGYTHLGNTGAAALADLSTLSGLTRLDLGGNCIGDDGVAALAGSPTLSGLTWLSLRWNNISYAGATALADSPHLSGLTWLDLGFNSIGDDGVAALVGPDSVFKTADTYIQTDDFSGRVSQFQNWQQRLQSHRDNQLPGPGIGI